MALRGRKKTVAFFEIRDMDGNSLREPIPWAEHLAEISRESADDRKHRINEYDHWGQVYTYLETDHLILAKLRDGVSSYNPSTGDILDSESDSGKPWVEISVIHFLPNTNRLGFVLGSQASPRISSLQTWINLHGIVDKGISIAPVLAKDVLSRIRGAAEVSVLKVKYESDQLAAIDGDGKLGQVKRLLGEEIHHTTVELVLRVEGGTARARKDERLRLLDLAKEVSVDNFAEAVAKVVNYNERGKPVAEDVNYLAHRIARKERVLITDKEGKSVKVTSAIEAIYRAADRLKQDLY